MTGAIWLTGCGTSIKLAVPEKFKEQATMQHVDGARSNRMSFAGYTTSKIKRGIHMKYPGWGGRGYFLENLLWSQVGISKTGVVEKEKAGFRYALTDGRNVAEIFATEKQVTETDDYELTKGGGIFNGFEVLQHYEYIFSALISMDTTQESKTWELMMTNLYDRKALHDKNPFAYVKPEDKGLATNGTDTIHIKPLSLQKTELSNGKTGQLPFKLMSGYELSIDGGVVAIVDMIDRNIWFYNELSAGDKLSISAIATALFARRVHDVKW